ncbi:MAG TPA: response regulator transcription factor [Rhodothermales bacterium]|nr:response regulator transcription factor [Rhodothermales bacterium]
MPDAPPTPPPTILVVDDEPDLLDLLQYNLEREGYAVLTARDGAEALSLAARTPPDLVVLDVMMPVMDGLDTCRRLREHATLRTTPVLMLTAREGPDDHVQGLDVGADAYLGKGAPMPVLLSQVRALLRGATRAQEPPGTLRVHDLEINRERYLVFRDEQGERVSMRLPRKEFELLYLLASHPGKVFTRQDILDRVWGRDVYVVDRTVDVHVRKIREKLGEAYIETVKGVGYRFLK